MRHTLLGTGPDQKLNYSEPPKRITANMKNFLAKWFLLSKGDMSQKILLDEAPLYEKVPRAIRIISAWNVV